MISKLSTDLPNDIKDPTSCKTSNPRNESLVLPTLPENNSSSPTPNIPQNGPFSTAPSDNSPVRTNND